MAALELHIWGPAFGLPSIEAECIAAVALLHNAVREGEWVLVASHDRWKSPTGDFPLLVDGCTAVGGYDAIVKHLSHRSGQRYDLDANLSSAGQADSTAFKAYIRTSLAPIVDAALYLATDNHYYCTRPAWIAILPTHLNYLHPPARETVAKARAATLDLSSADFDDRPEARSATRFQTVHQRYEHAKRMASQFGVGGSDGTEAAAPASSTLAGLERQGAASRLDWLLDTCFATLESVYGEDWEGLLDDEGPSSLDCLLLGYLSLLAYPAFRNTRIQDVLKGRHASLYTHTKDMRDRYLGSGYIAADDALRPSTGRSPAQPSKKEGLPWKRAASGPAWAGAFAATMNISSSVIPGLSAVMLRYRQNALLADSSPKDAGAEEGYFSLSNVGKAALTCSSLGLLGWGAYWLFVFHRQLRDREHLFLAARSVRLSTFGAVGAAFALFGSGAGHLAGGNGGRLGGLQPPEQDGPQAVIAEVTAEVDG